MIVCSFSFGVLRTIEYCWLFVPAGNLNVSLVDVAETTSASTEMELVDIAREKRELGHEEGNALPVIGSSPPSTEKSIDAESTSELTLKTKVLL